MAEKSLCFVTFSSLKRISYPILFYSAQLTFLPYDPVMRKIILLLAFVSFALSGHAQLGADTVAKIEALFTRYKATNPGAQLAISRNGQTLFSKAWGMGDLEHPTALTTSSPVEAGSVSKQFTAAAILLLEQEGKLSLSDDVRKHVPELPPYGTTVTLRHMMQHTSGLKDWGVIAAIAGWPRGTKTYTNEDALHIASLQPTLNHLPGDEYIYSNTNYNLFAVIVERVSGKTLAEYTKEKIFEPAGMSRTQWRADYRKVVPDRAIAYSKASTGYLTNMPNEYVYGNGGLLTTAEDLLKWNDFYLSGKFGNPSLLQKQLSTTAFNNGVMHTYAAGLFVTIYKGWQLVTHDGATAGYRASLDYFPELGLSIAWLSNTAEFDREAPLAQLIRDVFLPKKALSQSPAPAHYAMDEKGMAGYAGWYKNSRTNGGLKLYTDKGKFYATGVGEIRPVEENVFMIGNNRFEMTRGKHRGILFISSAKDSLYFTAVDSFATGEKLDQYAGNYYSAEAMVAYELKLKDGKLIALVKPKTEMELTPTFRDGFNFSQGTIYFERGKNKKIEGFKISSGRARHVAFKRVG